VALTVHRIDAPRRHPAGKTQLWHDPRFAEQLGTTWWLEARRGSELVGTWLVPLEETAAGPVARLQVRSLPYASPWLVDTQPDRRRHVFLALLRALQQHTAGIELPLAPWFYDYGAVCEAGGFLEGRHTHVLPDPGSRPHRHTARVRNHIRAARNVTRIVVRVGVDGFEFDRAIVGVPEEHVTRRRSLARQVAALETARTAEAWVDDRLGGQAVALVAGGWALVIHSWFDRTLGLRGIPTLLIDSLDNDLRSDGTACVTDLEGSILASVDAFMDGLGAPPVPYAIAYWYAERATLLDRLSAVLDMPGRAGPKGARHRSS
jgi:hypothetical protein